MVVPANSAFAEEGELAEPPVKVLAGLLECGKIHHPPPGAGAPPPPRPLKIPISVVTNYQSHDNSQPPIAFPPVNHENLHISDSDSDSDSDSITDSNSLSTFTPSDSSPIVHSPLFTSPRARLAACWFDSWTEILHSKVNGIMRFLWTNLASSRGMFLTFRSAAITALVIVFLYLRQRRKLRVGEESRARLVGIIKDRDERINQLLDQISQMNQVLVGMAHHRFPSSHTRTLDKLS